MASDDASAVGLEYESCKGDIKNMKGKLPSLWSTAASWNVKTNFERVSSKTDSSSVIFSQHQQLKRRTILVVLVVCLMATAILVPLTVIIALPKKDSAQIVSTVEITAKILNKDYTQTLENKESTVYNNFTDNFCTQIEILYLASDLRYIYDGCVVTDLRPSLLLRLPRNGSVQVFFTITFVSETSPTNRAIETVLTKPREHSGTEQETVKLGTYLLDKTSINVGTLTVVDVEYNPVPRISYNSSCRLSLSCKTRQAECMDNRCQCPTSRYYSQQADRCFRCGNPFGTLDCDKLSRYRTADGTCNNIEHPVWGSAMTPQLRLIPPVYDDGVASPRRKGVDGGPLPSPRVISNTVFSSTDPPPRNKNLTMMVMQWGQFIDHEFVKTPVLKGEMGSSIECCSADMKLRPECFPIDVPGDDPYFNTSCMNFVRSLPATNQPCGKGYRNQLNAVTSFIDGSAVYGSNIEEMMSLRTGRNGLLETDMYGCLPQATPDLCVLEFANDHCQKAGDSRVDVVPSLGWSHTTFLREHNRIAKILGNLNPHWSDEVIFQETRRIIAAYLQHITYNEYLDAFLSNETMQKHRLRSNSEGYANVYDSSVDPTIANVFAAAAFRHGHSQIANYQATMDKEYLNLTSKQPIEATYKNPHMIQQRQGAGLDGVARWLVHDLNPLTDRLFGAGVRNKLFERSPGGGLDLPALNIQRGRDHGIASYNHWRTYCNLSRAVSFETLADHADNSRELLKKVYRHVDDIDLYVGALTETHQPGSFLGPAFTCLIAEQFRKLKIGDRFWYESPDEGIMFTIEQLSEIKKISLAKIICNNYDIETIQPNVFKVPSDRDNRRVPCDDIQDINLSKWTENNDSNK